MTSDHSIRKAIAKLVELEKTTEAAWVPIHPASPLGKALKKCGGDLDKTARYVLENWNQLIDIQPCVKARFKKKK